MLPDIHLDQNTFEELMEKAKSRIAGCYPRWTDFNYHDPGITLAELFAWLEEIQQYELNHIGDAHRRQYLKLLGESARHSRPARAFVCVPEGEALSVYAGTRMDASGVPFEAEEEQYIPGAYIRSAFGVLEGQRVSYTDEEQLKFRRSLEFYPFGRKAQAGTSFYLNFSGPLPVGKRLALTIRTSQGTGAPRNPAGGTALPLADISWSFWNGRAWRPLEILRDETFELLADGQLVFQLPEELQPRTADGEEGWYLRAKLRDSQYETPPALSFLGLNAINARQKETAAAWLPGEVGEDGSVSVRHGLAAFGTMELFRQEGELFFPVRKEELQPNDSVYVLLASGDEWYQGHRILGRGYGFPEQKFSLEETGLFWEDFELLVEEAERPGVWRRWEKRSDFSHSGPEDFHYCLDSRSGQVIFGDCEHGMAPEGLIQIVSCSRTQGQSGNVKAEKITRLFPEDGRELTVSNPWDASDGRDEETMEEAFSRIRKQLSQEGPMVTAADYEREVRQTPGLRIESCRASAAGSEPGEMQAGNVMQIVVRPCSLEKRPKLTEAFSRNILKHLECRRLLGVEIRLQSPVYIRLRVDLEVAVHPQYQGAREKIESAAASYLRPLSRQFAGTVSYSGLYGHIDRLDCVAGIRSLVLDAKGNGVRRDSYGDLIFPGNGIADEVEINCSCSVRE